MRMYNAGIFRFFAPPALDEAAERFRELQAEKELRQLQEDRRNDKKPPPYKHVKVSIRTQAYPSGDHMPSGNTSDFVLTHPTGEQTDWQSADHYGRLSRDPTLQLQSDGREPLRHGLGVHQPHAALRMPPSGLPSGGEVPKPVLHQAPVLAGGNLQDLVPRLGPALRSRHQEGRLRNACLRSLRSN